MNTAMRGNATEAAVLSAFVEREFLRVQCKTARLVHGCVGFNSRSTDHGRGPGRYTGLADAFSVHFPPTDTIYLVPVEEVASLAVQLRLKPALNNQRKRVRMAADYEIEHWTDEALRGLCERADAQSQRRALQVA